LFFVLFRFVLLCFASLCFALLCFALLCFVLFCFVSLPFSLLCIVSFCFVAIIGAAALVANKTVRDVARSLTYRAAVTVRTCSQTRLRPDFVASAVNDY